MTVKKRENDHSFLQHIRAIKSQVYNEKKNRVMKTIKTTDLPRNTIFKTHFHKSKFGKKIQLNPETDENIFSLNSVYINVTVRKKPIKQDLLLAGVWK